MVCQAVSVNLGSPVDIVFAQYNPDDEEADGAEGAAVAKQLYADGKCKNIILCADSNDE